MCSCGGVAAGQTHKMTSRKDGLSTITGPRVHQSLSGNSIYSSGRASQRTATTGSTPIVCMVLFQFLKGLTCMEEVESD